jgi:hypothetical protein
MKNATTHLDLDKEMGVSCDQGKQHALKSPFLPVLDALTVQIDTTFCGFKTETEV